MRDAVALTIGFVGQGLFTVRVVWQWIASERAGRTVIPRAYWPVSLLAAAFVLAYAILVNNPIFALSVVPGAVVAVRNLLIRRPARRAHLLPFAAALGVLVALSLWVKWSEPDVGPAAWAAVGLAGSALWGARIVVQWWVSERLGVSTLPLLYWALSLLGGLLLLAYAVSRVDPVMIAGYAFGCVPYLRNIKLVRAHVRSA